VGGDANGVDVFPVMPMSSGELDMIPMGMVWVFHQRHYEDSEMETYLA